MTASNLPLNARCEQLIRRPAADVFNAFVQPDMLCRFWLLRSSGPLRAGAKVRWEFLVPGAVDDIEVLTFEPNARLVVRSSDGTLIHWTFTSRAAGQTVVAIEQTGFSGDESACRDNALEATQGFTLVLSSLKVLLESGRDSRLVHDKAELIKEHQQSRKG